MRNRFLQCAALIILGTSISCRQSQPLPVNKAILESPSPQQLPMLDAPEILFTDFLKEEEQVEDESKSPLLHAWKRIPGYQHYRIARAPDFKIPAWVENEIDAKDIDRAINYPYAFGELSGAHGLAAIIIDKRIQDSKRFSCVVFISRPSKRYDIYWIFKNEDLSRFTMGRHSGDVYLLELRDDRTRQVCDLQYSRKQKRWACEFYS